MLVLILIKLKAYIEIPGKFFRPQPKPYETIPIKNGLSLTIVTNPPPESPINCIETQKLFYKDYRF